MDYTQKSVNQAGDNEMISLSLHEVCEQSMGARHRSLMQISSAVTYKIDFLLDLFKKAKKQGVNTCIDTSANPFTTKEPFYSKWKELMEYTDLLLLDIKHIDNEQHKILTGQPNTNILEMARQLSDMGKPVWIRHVLVPERNDKDEYLFRLADFIRSLKNVERVEVLPYHTLGVYKWKALGYDYPLEGIEPPTKERVKNAEMILNGEKTRD